MPESFPKYFNPEELGRSLKEVATDVIKSSGHNVVSRWFHSSKDADLFIWMDLHRNILKQQLSYYGQVVEWNAVEGVRTGHVVIEESEAGEKSHGSEFLHFDQKPLGTSIDQALRLLDCITALNEEERKVLRDNFLRLGASQTMPPEELIRRFGGIFGSESAISLRYPWWRRIVSRISRWLKI